MTPDSFSDGGQFNRLDAALRQAERMAEEGVAIFDVGGESTRPGAADVAESEELSRVIPLIEALSLRFDLPISIDTQKPAVMRAAIAAGAGLINDVNALRAEGALALAAELAVPVCLMHMQGEPRTMQSAPAYADVVLDVMGYLQKRADKAIEAGVLQNNIILDPGFGFGKTLEHNLILLAQLSSLVPLGYPLLVGTSRKRMIGEITGRGVGSRVAGGLAATVVALQQGAKIVRTHDVAETMDVVKMHNAINAEQ